MTPPATANGHSVLSPDFVALLRQPQSDCDGQARQGAPPADDEVAQPEPPAESPSWPSAAPPPARPRMTLLRMLLALRWRPLDGDTVITWAMAAVVSAVAGFAAVVSYTHIRSLATAHGEDALQAHLLPLSIDGVIGGASLVLLFAARRKLPAPPLARVMLWVGIVATLGANVVVSLPSAWINSTWNAVIGALLSAWPAAAFIGSVEMMMRLVRDTRAVATQANGGPDDDSGRDRKPPAGRGGRRHPKTTARAKIAAILSANPELTDDEVAKRIRGSVSRRTIQRAREDAKRAATT